MVNKFTLRSGSEVIQVERDLPLGDDNLDMLSESNKLFNKFHDHLEADKIEVSDIDHKTNTLIFNDKSHFLLAKHKAMAMGLIPEAT